MSDVSPFSAEHDSVALSNRNTADPLAGRLVDERLSVALGERDVL